MAVIRGTIELLCLRHKESTELCRRLSTITDQIDHMNQLTQDVLEFSRGKFHLNIETVTMSDYFAAVRAAHVDGFDNAGIGLKIVVESNYRVPLDPVRFQRVIDNILNNAREALKPGQAVRIDWESPQGELRLLIVDNGPGIPEQIRETIFEPFVTSGKETGTGLGLAIAKKIVDDHNFSIEVASAPGHDTTFIITIPETLVTPVARAAAATLCPHESDRGRHLTRLGRNLVSG